MPNRMMILLCCSTVCLFSGCRTAEKVGQASVNAAVVGGAAIGYLLFESWADQPPEIETRELQRKGITPGSRRHKQLQLEVENVADVARR